jgi:hypothetical protein
MSWLEALSYGALIVSAFDRDNIVARFGTFVGEIMGDGTDETSIKAFAGTIEYWMTHDLERGTTAQKAIDFIRDRHSIRAPSGRRTAGRRADCWRSRRYSTALRGKMQPRSMGWTVRRCGTG